MIPQPYQELRLFIINVGQLRQGLCVAILREWHLGIESVPEMSNETLSAVEIALDEHVVIEAITPSRSLGIVSFDTHTQQRHKREAVQEGGELT